MLRRISSASVVAFAPLWFAGCVAQTAGQERQTSARTGGCNAPVQDEQEPFKATVRAMLERQQFGALDDLADELHRTKARFARRRLEIVPLSGSPRRTRPRFRRNRRPLDGTARGAEALA